jgi:hypothetical protein
MYPEELLETFCMLDMCLAFHFGASSHLPGHAHAEFRLFDIVAQYTTS